MNIAPQIIDQVLLDLADLILENKAALLEKNQIEMGLYNGDDSTMLHRLKVDEHKCAVMMQGLKTLAALENPLNKLLYTHIKENGLVIENRTAPFGTVLIIYESRPDVTIEAAAIAFKSGNKIRLKGGKESHQTNQFLVQLWHQALEKNKVDTGWVTYLELNREATQQYLKANHTGIDLVVPRGGEQLIQFVKLYATAPVLVSGRGNNFIYIDEDADLTIIAPIILNAKLSNISACNALDKVIVNREWKAKNELFWKDLLQQLEQMGTELIRFENQTEDAILYEEFLAKKLVWVEVKDLNAAINCINKYSGKHSAAILSTNENNIQTFLEAVDCAAVYANASTRFTDGGQFGLGAELAISTDKLHHRGPIGLQHLVTNKWIIKGNGQIRT